MGNEFIDILIYSFATAFGITFISIPVIIKVSKEKKLYDEPNPRKSHFTSIPTLGGLGIFGGVLFAITFWSDFTQCPHLQYIVAAMVVISFIGIKDDLTGLAISKKFTGQMVAAIILVIWGDIRIDHMFGIFGLGEIPYIFSVLFSIFTILVIINSFNMIDGINGLLGSIGIISAGSFGIWFYLIDDFQHAIISVAIVGSLLAFLRYNISPARIFMGDTGSMLLGLMLSVIIIEFIQKNVHFTHKYAIDAAPVIAIGSIFIPLYDLLRVFSIRIFKGKSPFKPDRNHLHHLLIDAGFTHNFATFILSLFSLFLLVVSIVLRKIGTYYLGLLLLGLSGIFTIIVFRYSKKKSKSLNK
ncbi:MAG: MraY family glycosyltransferase [Marinilabiliales bacterium]